VDAAPRYHALGGTRRRYYDGLKREVISRRQYLKRHGIFPAAGQKRPGASSVPAAPPAHLSEKPTASFVRRVTLPTGGALEVRPLSASRFHVWYRNIAFAIIQLERRGTRHRWRCAVVGCEHIERSQHAIALHGYDAHYDDACRLVGARAPGIIPIVEVRSNARRARMPWRVDAPEFK